MGAELRFITGQETVESIASSSQKANASSDDVSKLRSRVQQLEHELREEKRQFEEVTQNTASSSSSARKETVLAEAATTARTIELLQQVDAQKKRIMQLESTRWQQTSPSSDTDLDFATHSAVAFLILVGVNVFGWVMCILSRRNKSGGSSNC